MSYLFKDFLSLEDVGEYLNQHGYSYDAEIEEDYYKLKANVLDLYHEKKLNIVFYYDDFAVIKTLRIAENLGIEEVEEEEFEQYISGYFNVPEAPSMLKNECNLAIIESSYAYYFLHDKEKLPIYNDGGDYKYEVGRKFTSIEFGDSITPSIIEFSDLRYPKADLDKLFNNKNSELKSVKDELADVKAQNAKLIADKEEHKATGSFMMGSPTVANGEPKTNEQLTKELTAANTKIADLESQLAQANAAPANVPADEAELNLEAQELAQPLHPRTANNASKIIAALASELLKMDITKPYASDSNGEIKSAIERQGNTVSKDVIGYWLELAHKNSI